MVHWSCLQAIFRQCSCGVAIALKMSMRARPLIFLFLMQALATSAAARDGARELLDSWSRRMAETESALKAEDYKDALRLANRTITEMVERLGPGEGSAELFGNAL